MTPLRVMHTCKECRVDRQRGPHRQLDVARDDAGLLVVARGVAAELQDLGAQVPAATSAAAAAAAVRSANDGKVYKSRLRVCKYPP
jgi:hypothetical protein